MDIKHQFRSKCEGRCVRPLACRKRQFADMVDVHRAFMSGIRRGVRAQTIITVDKIAIALNASIGVLFRDVEPSDRGLIDFEADYSHTPVGRWSTRPAPSVPRQLAAHGQTAYERFRATYPEMIERSSR